MFSGMTNAEIAAALDELGDLYELDGAVIYRVVAYREAAQSIRNSAVSVAQLAREGRATELRNVGKTLQEKIQALLQTGDIPAASKLRAKFPGELVQFMRIPGLGPKTARRIHAELGISTLEELRAAAETERLRSVPGLGPKAEQNIAAALAKLEEEGPAERMLLSAVLALGEQIVEHLRSRPAADRVEIAGSARRMTDTCKDLDIVATAHDAAALTQAFTEVDLLGSVGSSGAAGARGVTHNGLQVDFRVVDPDQYGNVLQHLTGSKQHNMELRDYAVRRGLHVSEYGVEEDESGTVHRCETEERVYEVLGLPYIEPELREGRGELQAAIAGSLPRLVTEADLRGDMHCHTTLSDGRSSLEDMAKAAEARGYEYLAVTDHSASHGFGNDVQPDELLRQVERVRALNGKLERLRVLAGSEVNINLDGSLDYDDEVLAELDWVIASVHTSFRMGEEAMTERMMAAMDHPLVDAIGHPTGRKILRRDPYAVDVERLVAHAAETGTFLEINSNPDRRDLSDIHARLAAEAGVKVLIDSDAHSARTLAVVRYGVATARRGWLTKEHVANTRTWKQLQRLRSRARTKNAKAANAKAAGRR
jgi:DNA polymerase (family X)